MPRKVPKLFRSFLLLAVSLVSLFIFFDLWPTRSLIPQPASKIPTSNRSPASDNASPSPASPACPESPLLNDILVVIRTGATEVLVKLPVHFRTVLTCVPDYVIYSDLEEDIDGEHHAFDVLKQVSEHHRSKAPEFKLYNQLLESGRKGLEYQTSFGSGPSGALDNPGWKLDKWKFLPMLDRAYQHRPNAKWFVFIEPDTYLIWQNMLRYLERFDPDKPYYMGTGMYIGKVLFAHGGSGFMISNPAMKTVLEYWKSKQDWFDEYTANEWAGDMVLGRAMKDAGIDLYTSSPHIQGSSLTMVDWSAGKQNKPHWCYAPLTYHHMTEPEFQMLWQFEESWRRYKKPTEIFRYSDVFKTTVQPQIQSQRNKWDNLATGTEYSDAAFAKLTDDERKALSDIERKAQNSFEDCRTACMRKTTCIQFSHAPGKCLVAEELRVGHAAKSQCLEYSTAAGKCVRTKDDEAEGGAVADKDTSPRSGWIMSRVVETLDKMDQACHNLQGNVWAN